MAQDFADALLLWLTVIADFLRNFYVPLVGSLLALFLLWIVYAKLSPEDSRSLAARLEPWRRPVVAFLAVCAVSAGLCLVLVQARRTVLYRHETAEEASASRKDVPNLSGVTQFAPSVAYLEDKTYTRTLTLPPDFLNRLGSEGLEVLAPYIGDPGSEDAAKLVDQFRKKGRLAVFTRQLTRQDEIPIAADSATVNVNIQDRGVPNGQRFYEAEFTGTYRFHNPNQADSNMRLNFPPPQGGGTIQGFSIDVGNTHVTEPDEHGLYLWNGLVPPGKPVEAVVHYKVTGGDAFLYMLGSERRRIGQFQMKVACATPLTFGRTAIYPSSLSSGGAEWDLKDVLTSQSIEMRFPRSNMETQLFDKTLSMLPVVAVTVGLLSVFLTLGRPILGTALFGLGLLVIPALSAYMLPVPATIVGSLLALVLSVVAFRSLLGLFLAGIGAVMTCAFLTSENGTLVMWVCLAALLGLVWLRYGRRALVST